MTIIIIESTYDSCRTNDIIAENIEAQISKITIKSANCPKNNAIFDLKYDWRKPSTSSKAPSRDFLTVSVSTDGYKVPVMFAQNDMATEGYDIYDANKMFGSGSAAEKPAKADRKKPAAKTAKAGRKKRTDEGAEQLQPKGKHYSKEDWMKFLHPETVVDLDDMPEGWARRKPKKKK